MIIFLLAICFGCKDTVDAETSADWQEIGGDAVAAGDYETAIRIVQENMADDDPETWFTVGWLMLEWLMTPEPVAPPDFSHEQALVLIRQAAKHDVPQAVETLRAGYEWGRYSLPKNESLANCWRDVEFGRADYDSCAAMERSLAE